MPFLHERSPVPRRGRGVDISLCLCHIAGTFLWPADSNSREHNSNPLGSRGYTSVEPRYFTSRTANSKICCERPQRRFQNENANDIWRYLLQLWSHDILVATVHADAFELSDDNGSFLHDSVRDDHWSSDSSTNILEFLGATARQDHILLGTLINTLPPDEEHD